MTHPQAHFTSSRLDGASPALGDTRLAALASAHSGDDQPVTLTVSFLDGIGPVAVRSNGAFTHVVAGPFDELLGIELWDAPHWRDAGTGTAELDELPALEPGPLDAPRALALLAGAPDGVAAALLEATLGALDGGPRVVLVEPDDERRAAWIAWVSYALPRAQARRLTFTTFSSHPYDAHDLHLCATAADPGGAVIDATRPAAVEAGLYARVAVELARRDPRALPAAAEDADGVALAVAGGAGELVPPAELPRALALIGDLAEDGKVAAAARAAAAVPGPSDAALDGWLGLHLVARRLPDGADSRALAEAALRQLVPFAAELPEDAPFVGAHAPTKPAADAIEPWLRAVEAAAGTPASGALLAGGVELGLLGVDAALDRRAATAIVAGIELDTVQAAMPGIGRQALLDPLIATVAGLLADGVEQDAARRPQLRALCRHPAAFAVLSNRAQARPTLAITSVYLWAVVDRDPARRPSAARTLLMLDAGADVRALWGEDGPADHEQHAALLDAYHEAERRPPDDDVRRALECLMAESLANADKRDPLALALRGLPEHAELPAYCAWYAAARRPGGTHRLDAWARIAARALSAREVDVPAPREAELLAIAAEELVAPRTLDGYFVALERLRSGAGAQRFDRALVNALAAALDAHEDPTELLAAMFSIWSKAPDGGRALHDRVLAPAARPFRRDDDEVRAHLGPRRQAEWDAWTDRHGRPRFARVRDRLFARRGR